MRKFLLLLFPAVACVSVYGDVTLPPLISDNMLLQRSKAAVWGKADPGEKVKVTLGETSASATADKDGKWRVKLEGLKAGEAGAMTISGKNKLTIQNVAIGDVWVCSGQSNMEFTVNRGLNAQQEITSADSPDIRMFTVPKKASETPVDEVDGKWEVCDPSTVSHFSAVGYFFARQLHDDLHIPVGMIHSSWGGTAAQSWTPAETLQADAEFNVRYYTPWQAWLPKYPAAKLEYETKTLPAWQTAADQAKAAGQPIPRKPGPPDGPGSCRAPGGLYNGMLFGATQYPIKGAIWYQGEANAGDAVRYRKLLPAMIGSWRKAWNVGDFPFLIVQLANFMARRDLPADSNWADLRDAQRLTLDTTPNTAMAVAIDIGDDRDIHPKNKQEVGRRLALAAEAKVYGKELISSGPLFDTAKFDGSNVKITFKPGTAIGLTSKDGEPLKGFALAGDDHKFIWADAKIVTADSASQTVATSSKKGKAGKKAKAKSAPSVAESTILVTSLAIPNPIAVRYAWADNPEVNLVNKAGLPASSFRSDDWLQTPPPPIVLAQPSPSPAAKPAASPASAAPAATAAPATTVPATTGSSAAPAPAK